jgi:hypothetical protein
MKLKVDEAIGRKNIRSTYDTSSLPQSFFNFSLSFSFFSFLFTFSVEETASLKEHQT